MSTVTAFDISRLPDTAPARFRRSVPPDRRERAALFPLVADRKRCLTAGVLLRHALILRHGLTADELTTAKNTQGKPFLVDRPDVHFNLSHAGNWVVCATGTSEIGVDIEHISAGATDISHRFAPDEYAFVSAAPPAERPRRLVRIWTLKESYVKYLGRGLTVPLNSFSVAPPDPRPRILRGSLDPRPFLRQTTHHDDYYIAVCTPDDTPLTVTEPSLDELLTVC
ncbi:4'-phosphopantetheinyl transferase superfamily protein [Streptomyces sp. NPDC000594]|uniref:4'-phosphopantetheinyl transferase family protein n=1 Tax=Streptomyces sp. NPDC000594 TaxID=3154261 RepID=UPI00332DF406